MEHMDVSEFQSACLETLERVRQTGEPLEILKEGQPVAVVYPAPATPRREAFGSLRGTFVGTVDDLITPVGDEGWDAVKE
ncbi:MAG: hypothetical protein JNN08_27235 [Bryobacterales bacterium]|nr:hypothetical protein [Bryobacterales bacterium]